MKSNFKYYKLSVWLFLLCTSVFFVYSESFPPERSQFDFVLALLVSLFTFLVTKKKYTSFVFAASLCSLIIFASLMKQKYMGIYLYFSDVIFYIQNPLFVLKFVSVPLLCIVSLVWIVYIILLYLNEPKTKFRARHTVLLVCSVVAFCYLMQKFDNRHAPDRKAGTETLQNFVGSIYTSNALSLPNSEFNSVVCCQKAQKDDINITKFSQEKRPNIVFVLLESTFDLTSIPSLGIEDPWTNFRSRPLEVPTSGGGTWTAEYSILHGINMKTYGPSFPRVNILGPGLLDGRIAPALKSIGYHTYSVMPYKRSFYNTENYHRSLGIDTIVDCTGINSCGVKSRVVQDQIMYEQVYDVLKNANEPAFVFALTMVQHSPHDLSLPNQSIKCDGLSDRACDVLQEYKNREMVVQNQIKWFLEKINAIDKETIVIFFGDHIPADVHASLDESHFLNQSKYTTLAFGYSTRTKKFVDLYEVLGNCNQNFKLHIEDLDILPLYMARMNSKYISQKYLDLRNSCQLGLPRG